MMFDASRRSARRLGFRLVAAMGLIAGATTLAGCGAMFASLPGIGEPAEAQNRPAVQPPTPNVYQPSAESNGGPMTANERAKVEADLRTARDRAAAERREQINSPDGR
jgi:hypothetical protein